VILAACKFLKMVL